MWINGYSQIPPFVIYVPTHAAGGLHILLGLLEADLIIMPPPHPTLPNNQSFSPKPGKAPSVIGEASGYPNAFTRTCSGDFWVGLS